MELVVSAILCAAPKALWLQPWVGLRGGGEGLVQMQMAMLV